jgi:hypothetical protein
VAGTASNYIGCVPVIQAHLARLGVLQADYQSFYIVYQPSSQMCGVQHDCFVTTDSPGLDSYRWGRGTSCT